MVNEVNKPTTPENIILGERLAASHRQLQEMQEEHRQLLQEMEMLRQRAAELSRLNAQQDELYLNRANAMPHNAPPPLRPSSASSNATVNDAGATAATSSTAENVVMYQSQTETSNTPATETQTGTTANESHAQTDADADASANAEDDDPETAEYLHEKLAEIAALKARYKRVQNMMNTTELIEKHMSTRDASTTNNAQPAAVNTSTTSAQHNIGATITAASPPTFTNIAPNSNTHSANEELLSTMMNMFTDFTSDLRSQAEDLRAERDRIRLLKEDLLRRKQQS